MRAPEITGGCSAQGPGVPSRASGDDGNDTISRRNPVNVAQAYGGYGNDASNGYLVRNESFGGFGADVINDWDGYAAGRRPDQFLMA